MPVCESSLVLAFCECDEIMKLAASSRRHWTAEIFTVKMISSSRRDDWSRYKLLSPSVRSDENGPLEHGIQRHNNFRGPSTRFGGAGVSATCDPGQGVFQKALWGVIFYICAYFRYCRYVSPVLQVEKISSESYCIKVSNLN